MTSPSFDVVIVGARCAGASLAVHLRRAGLSVALLDAARLPSDQPISTHLIQPPGMDELDRLDVGATVRGLTPALRAGRFVFDGAEMRLTYGAGRAAHCLRRSALDALLQDAAVRAGAVLQPETRVEGLQRDRDGRVRGVAVRRRGGGLERLDAELVVGADGRQSTVARLVGATEYLGYNGPRSAYWAYWHRPAAWDASEFYLGLEGDDGRSAFPTDGDLLVVSTTPPLARAQRGRADHGAAYLDDLRRCATLSPLLAQQQPVSRVRGMLRTRYFFRAAAGPGWALVGDAGHHKDFVVGFGIADALRDARSLADAVRAGNAAALQRWWLQRDVDRIAMFRWAQDLGAADEVNAVERLAAARVGPASPLASRFGAVIDGRLSPYEMLPPMLVLRWVGAELLRANLRPLRPLLAMLSRALRVQDEGWRYRRRLAALPVPVSCAARTAACVPVAE